MDRASKYLNCAAKSAFVESRTLRGDLSSLALVKKGKICLVEIVLDDTLDPAPESETLLLEGAFQKVCSISLSSFQEQSDHLMQCAWDEEMKVELILTDTP